MSASAIMRAIRFGPYSLRYRPRVVFVAVLCTLLLAAMALITVLSAGAHLTLSEVWTGLMGSGDAATIRSVRSRRIPRILVAMMVGGALGVSGAIIQSLSRNVLGSPDLMGLTVGAAATAGYYILYIGIDVLGTALAAAAGGIGAAILVYALAIRDGTINGLQLVLVGIGVGATLGASIDLLVIWSDVRQATDVAMWRAGSLSGRGWPHVWMMALSLALLLPPLAGFARHVNLIEMGDDAATSLGVRTEHVRRLATLGAVLLACAATAVAGPIAFVALAAPHIARRLMRCAAVPLLGGFLFGALLLLVADYVSVTVNLGWRTPVGLITSFLGGSYLVWLLAMRRT